MPIFFVALLLVASVVQATGIHSASFDHSSVTLSLDLSVNNTGDQTVLLHSFIESVSAGEFTLPAPLAINFSINQSVLLQVNATAPLSTAYGGLADVVNDGCVDRIGGADMCVLRGFTQPGDFHWCSPCDYFNPNCGNTELHDWCYRYYPQATHDATSSFNSSGLDFSISIAAADNFSCAVYPGANCSQQGFSADLLGYSFDFSQPLVALIKPSGAASWQSVSPAVLQSYSASLAYYNSHYTASIPDAASATSYLNSALAALLQNASGNYSGSFNYSPAEQAVFPELSLSLNALAFNFTPLRGRPEIVAVNSSPQSDGNETFFPVFVKNAGFKDDNFSLAVACNDSSNHFLSAAINSSEEALFEIPAANATPARECLLFAAAAGNPFLNDSAAVFFEAFIPQCPQELECCSGEGFLPKPCNSAVLFNDSGGYYYRQDYSCINNSCAESDSSLLYYAPPQTASSSYAGSSGSSFSAASFQPALPSPILSAPAASAPLPAMAPSPLAFVELAAHQEDLALELPPPLNPLPITPPPQPDDGTSGVYSATALFPLASFDVRPLLLFSACAAAAVFSYALLRPKIVFSKRFSNGRAVLRFENRSDAVEKIAVRDFVPEDAVFVTPPHSIDDTILGRLAEWRVASLQKNAFFEISYSCASPANKPASAEFSMQGKRFRLESP